MLNTIMELHVRRLPLDALKPHPRNPRRHPKPGSSAWQRLRKSLEHDYFDPLIWNERNGMLVSGHLRVKLMQDMGITEADVVVVDYDEATHLARMVAANRLTGEWDEPLLVDLATELQAADFDLDLTGFALDELETMRVLSTIPTANKSIDETTMAETKNECPKCGFRW